MTNGIESVIPDLHDQVQFNNRTFGLTKREYFASQALCGILKSEHIQDLKFSFEEILPKLAVMYADELIKQLNKTKDANT